MKIKCNLRCLDAAVTGVQRYTNSIMNYFPNELYTKVIPSKSFSHGVKGHFWEQLILPKKLKREEILWSPCNTGPLNFGNQVVTIHDLVPIDHPEWVSKNFARLYQYLLPKLCKNVKHIITISNFTKGRIIEEFGIREDKISVIYNGVDEAFFDVPKYNFQEFIPFDKYILALGALEPRKNLKGLLKAWSSIKNQVDENIGLVIVGAKGSSKVFGDYVLDNNIDRVYFTGYVDEKYIVSLYKKAMFFVYLSFYEGFGLPPLEAMATGCPIIASNQTAIPEIINDAGLLIDPYSQFDIENALLAFLGNEILRESYSCKGVKRAKRFNWKDSSIDTLKVIMNCN